MHASAPDAPPRRTGATIPARLRTNAVRGYPDAFYDAIASAYRHLAASSPRPVAELAEANGVPVTTAQRWVKEARRRRLLAPGHPGKAG
jgi:transposase-like protein